MNRLERGVRRIDAFQQRHLAPGFVIAVTKKFGDDGGGDLTVRLTYAMFTTVFPLLLLLETGLALVLAGHPAARQAVLHSTFSEFPVVGAQLASNIQVMQRNSAFGLAVGLVGLVYGLRGLGGSGLYVMERVWNIPAAIRPNYWTRLGRTFVFVVVLGFGVLLTTALSGFGTYSAHGFWLSLGAEAGAAVINVAIYLGAFRVLTPKQIATARLLPGVVLAGIVWTVLQALGGYVVGHYLRSDNAVYGTFGTVLGLIAWLSIGAQVTAYAAEINVVLARRLWPRGIVQPPLTDADQRSIVARATEDQRRPEQEVLTWVHGSPMSQDEYRAAGFATDERTGAVGRAPSGPGRDEGWDEAAPGRAN